MHGLFCQAMAPDVEVVVSEEDAAMSVGELQKKLERAQRMLKFARGEKATEKEAQPDVALEQSIEPEPEMILS